MIKKGFTLLETLLALMIVSSLLVVTLNKFVEPDLSWISFCDEYLLSQTDSLINKQENGVDGYNVHFNSMGRVNQAQTIHFNNKDVVIHLGNGYLTHE